MLLNSSLQILIHGKSARVFFHEGKQYIEGRKGTEFTIRVANNNYVRRLAIVSVDGLSVMDGKPCSYESGGYVLAPHSFMDIPGWRLDNDTVAKFFFSDKDKTYAKQSGKDNNNRGLIACALFDEELAYTVTWCNGNHLDPRQYYPSSTCGRSVLRSKGMDVNCQVGNDAVMDASFGDVEVGQRSMNSCYNVQSEIGTGFGQKADNHVVETTFQKKVAPSEVIEIQYDTRRGLQRRGIDMDQRPKVACPNPFPGNPQGCVPPAGWNG